MMHLIIATAGGGRRAACALRHVEQATMVWARMRAGSTVNDVN
jgi:uncharacterized protein (DUF1786 family)